MAGAGLTGGRFPTLVLRPANYNIVHIWVVAVDPCQKIEHSRGVGSRQFKYQDSGGRGDYNLSDFGKGTYLVDRWLARQSIGTATKTHELRA
jgi:hypothetical protein